MRFVFVICACLFIGLMLDMLLYQVVLFHACSLFLPLPILLFEHCFVIL